MCILFLLIGDDSSPTVICNNRDEYLARATSRGSLFDNGNIYSPVDQIGGGSWLSFSGLNENKLKFAVVLNFHYWRQPNVMPLTNEEFLKSRGLLIKNFMDSTVCSLDYAQSVFDSRTEYRPFNLIVGMLFLFLAHSLNDIVQEIAQDVIMCLEIIANLHRAFLNEGGSMD